MSYLSINETAAKLNVTRMTLYNWMDEGIAPKHEKVAGRTLFDKSAVEKAAKERNKLITKGE